MATEAQRGQRRNPAAAVTVLVLSARLTVRPISVAWTWSEQCTWIAVPSPHSALLVSVLSIFPFTTRLVVMNFPTLFSRQLPSPPLPPIPPPPLQSPVSIPKRFCKSRQRWGEHTLWHMRSCEALFLAVQRRHLLGGFSGGCGPQDCQLGLRLVRGI